MMSYHKKNILLASLETILLVSLERQYYELMTNNKETFSYMDEDIQRGLIVSMMQ